jgi:hypothetical protein
MTKGRQREEEGEATEPGDLPAWVLRYDASGFGRFAWTADVVGLALDPGTEALDALLVVRGAEPFRGLDAWPGGFVEARTDPDSRAAACRELREETGLDQPDFMEELGTYGRLGRDPRQFAGHRDEQGRWVQRGARVVTTAHLALLRKESAAQPAGGDDAESARWACVYDHLPWEDLRGSGGRATLDRVLRALRGWAGSGIEGDERRERIERAFAREGGRWNEELVADRYRLLHEAGLVEEAHRDRWGRISEDSLRDSPLFGRPMAFDHREILADALGRVRGKLKYVPRVLQALVGGLFTLDELQTACEAVAGRPLHRANFRRTVAQTKAAIVEPTGSVRETAGRGVDPQLFRFREHAVAARLDVSLRLPWSPLTSAE